MSERFERFSLAISEISRHWHKLTSNEMEKYGLKGPHSVYLSTLARYPEGLTGPMICELCGKDKADVSRMMGIMEKKGLVIKESTNRNLYRAVFKLTPEGCEAAEFVVRRATLAVHIAGRDMDDETREMFYSCLELISANLRELCRDGIPDDVE
ncbi:MAG: MarR family transcriptional regulator [Clostridia bacterium]|nr:MarR family transcriptional regulator [Clostridia bacterium]